MNGRSTTPSRLTTPPNSSARNSKLSRPDRNAAMKLYDLASTIRSKNAGVDHVTFDIICRERKNFERVRDSGALTRESVGRLFGVSQDQIASFVVFEPA